MSVVAHVDHSIEAFDRLASEWRRLLETVAVNHFFYTPTFLKTWWETLGEGELCLVSWRNQADNQLVGVLPLFVLSNEQGQGQLNFVGCKDVSDYLDMVVAAEFRAEVMTSLDAVLTNQLPEWERLNLCSIPGQSATLDDLEALAQRHGWSVEARQQDICPVIELPASWEAYLESLKRKYRHELRRKWRRLEQTTHHFRVVQEISELASNLETFIRLHKASSAEKARFWDDHHLGFFKLLTRRTAEQGWLKLYFLDVEETPAASMLVFDYHNQFYLYNSGFAPDQFAHLSTGNILTAYTIGQAIEFGRSRYDFLRGDEPYKFQLGGVPEPVCDITINRHPT